MIGIAHRQTAAKAPEGMPHASGHCVPPIARMMDSVAMGRAIVRRLAPTADSGPLPEIRHSKTQAGVSAVDPRPTCKRPLCGLLLRPMCAAEARDVTGANYGQSPDLFEAIEAAERLARRNGAKVVLSREVQDYLLSQPSPKPKR